MCAVLVLAVSLDDDIPPEGQRRHRLLRSGAEGLTLLGTVNPAETDALWVRAVHYFEGVAVEKINALPILVRPITRGGFSNSRASKGVGRPV